MRKKFIACKFLGGGYFSCCWVSCCTIYGSIHWQHANLDTLHYRSGSIGVDFFFVLSGFIIMYIHQHDVKNVTSAIKYVSKRFLRVFPVYWAVAIPLAAAYYFIPALSESGGAILTF